MRTARKIAIVLIALVVMTMVTALPAHAGAEGDFLSRINASRSAAGLPPVSMHSDLVPDARSHSAEMMAAGQIYHSSNLAGVASGWEALGENVGAGPSVDSLHSAFMNSAGHRANILGDYNYVGVGVAGEGDVLWVTVIFMRKGAAPEATTTTTTTTTTVPTTTSTTTTIAAPAATPTTDPPAPGPVSEATTTTTAPAPTSSTGTPASDQAAAEPPAPVPESGPNVEMQISVQALHLPIAD
ncbi:MAG: CAP domain-containing protein [Acidimicrobiia bacterium]